MGVFRKLLEIMTALARKVVGSIWSIFMKANPGVNGPSEFYIHWRNFVNSSHWFLYLQYLDLESSSNPSLSVSRILLHSNHHFLLNGCPFFHLLLQFSLHRSATTVNRVLKHGRSTTTDVVYEALVCSTKWGGCPLSATGKHPMGFGCVSMTRAFRRVSCFASPPVCWTSSAFCVQVLGCLYPSCWTPLSPSSVITSR